MKLILCLYLSGFKKKGARRRGGSPKSMSGASSDDETVFIQYIDDACDQVISNLRISEPVKYIKLTQQALFYCKVFTW